MSTSTNVGFDNQLASTQYGFAALVEMHFKQGILRATNWGHNLTALGQTWQGVSALAFSGLKETEDGLSQKMDVVINGVREQYLSLAMGAADTYQGRRIIQYMAAIDPATGRISGSPVKRFSGKMDKVNIDPKGDSSKVVIVCRSGSYDDSIDSKSIRMSHQQHKIRFPDDDGFNRLEGMVDKPVEWLTVKFQKR